MSEIDREGSSPDTKPIPDSPPCFTFLGFGLMVYGERNRDKETNTYLKTYCISALYIPIWNLCSFRVRGDEDDWFSLGKEPLSLSAKLWNTFVVVGILCAVAAVPLSLHFSTPEFKDGRRLVKAEGLARNGEVAEAARLYRYVARGSTRHVPAARRGLAGLVHWLSPDMPSEDVTEIMRLALKMHWEGLWPEDVGGLAASVLQAAREHAESSPRWALGLLERVRDVATDQADHTDLSRSILTRLLDGDPRNIELTSKLALILESDRDTEGCWELLSPHRERLGTSEGARILGRLLCEKERYDEACPLLTAYTERHLAKYRRAREFWLRTCSDAWDDMKEGRGPDSFYDRLESAGEAEREELIRDYVVGNVFAVGAVQRARARYREACRVVPAALDLGEILLRRNRTMPDLETRRAELEKVEATLLAIQGSAGDSDRYRWSLGRVQCFLGKLDEGCVQLDALLDATDRAPWALLGACRTFREVGLIAEARVLAEEAHEAASEDETRLQAAYWRAAMPIDPDDRVTWLKRCAPEDASVRALLSTATGDLAVWQARLDDAAEHYRAAIDICESQPETAHTLNNCARIHARLAGVTGERSALEDAAGLSARAIDLEPANGVFLLNAADVTLDLVLSDVVGDKIDLRTLRTVGHPGTVRFLYDTVAGRAMVRDRLRAQARLGQALSLWERATHLVPKHPGQYETRAQIHALLGDTVSLQLLLVRIQEVEPDTQDTRQRDTAYLEGKWDDRLRRCGEVRMKRLRTLLETRGKESQDTTSAVAASLLVSTAMGVASRGTKIDADELVQLASDAHVASPSVATRQTLIRAHLFRAGERLKEKSPRYAEMASRTAGSLSATYLIPIALGREGDMRDLVIRDGDVLRAVELIRQKGRLLPDGQAGVEWAILRLFDQEEADGMAESLRRDRAGETLEIIRLQLDPLGSTAAFDAYWRMMALGKDYRAREILRDAAARGAPMPYDP